MTSRFNYLNNNFTSGQLSPLLDRRSDLERRANGASKLSNVRVMPQGGVSQREGTIFQAEVKDSSKITQLIPFKFGITQNYMLEVGDLYMRVFTPDGGQILEADQTITAITKANPAVVTCGTHGYSNGDHVYITEVAGMTEINDSTLPYIVANKTATTFEVTDRDGNNVDSSAFTTYSSAGVTNKIFEIATPYVEADITDLQFTQQALVMTLTHQNYAPRDLAVVSDTSWSLTPIMKDIDSPSATLILNDGPYLNENNSTTTLTLSGTTGSVTVTASSAVGINQGDGFQTTDIGRLLRWHDGTDWTWLEITARADTTHVTATIKGEDAAIATGTERWRMGAWSETTGFPRTTTYFQQRQYYASSKEEVSKIWGSAIQDYVQFSPGEALDSEALNYELNSNGVYSIYWLAAGKKLTIGTEDGVWNLWSGNTSSSVTPTSAQADLENIVRCKNISPVSIGDTVIFTERSGKKIREASYNFEKDSVVATDITILSENIIGDIGDVTDAGAIGMSFAKEHYPIIYVAKDDGSLATLTYSREEDVVAWTDNVLGGSTAVKVKAVSTIPTTEQDVTWVIVSRTINSITRQFVERFDLVYRNRDVQDGIFLDSSMSIVGDKPAGTLTPGATTGSGITFTASSAIFAASDVGRVIESNGSKAEIITFTDTTHVVANITTDFASTSAIATGSWNLSINSIDGLEYLEGEVLQILANGGNSPDLTVSSGAITLDGQYNKVTFGLGYNADIELIDIDPSTNIGTAFGEKGKIFEAGIEFFETVGISHGQTSVDSTLDTVYFRLGTDNMGEGTPAKSGFEKIYPRGGWDDSLKIFLRQSQPLPFTIKSITLKGKVNE